MNLLPLARIGERQQLPHRRGFSLNPSSQIELSQSAASLSTRYELPRALAVKMAYFFDTV